MVPLYLWPEGWSTCSLATMRPSCRWRPLGDLALLLGLPMEGLLLVGPPTAPGHQLALSPPLLTGGKLVLIRRLPVGLLFPLGRGRRLVGAAACSTLLVLVMWRAMGRRPGCMPQPAANAPVH